MMKNLVLRVLVLLLLVSTNAYSYKVKVPTGRWVKKMATHPENWFLTAALADEATFETMNLPRHLGTFPGTPNAGEVRASAAHWKTMLNKFNANVKKEGGDFAIARTHFRTDYYPERLSLTDFLDDKFNAEDVKMKGFGTEVGNVIIFDNAVASNPKEFPTYAWTVEDVQELRDWLDNNNHGNVTISWDVRNNSKINQNWIKNPLIDVILYEASPDKYYNNIGNRQDALKLGWAQPNKKLIFLMPQDAIMTATFPNSAPTAYSQTRHFLKWLRGFMGDAFLKSDRVVFEAGSYTANLAFYPETATPTSYINTMTGIALSLLEQKELFENGTAIPNSYERYKQKQIITFPEIPIKKSTEPDFAPGAFVNTNEALSYTSSDPSVATIVANQIYVIKAGTSTITANQAGTSVYYQNSESQLLTVVDAKQNQTISFPEIATKQFAGVDFQGATASSKLPITYKSSNTKVATIEFNHVHIVGTGQAEITASQQGNLTYNAAPEVTRTLTVAKINQNIVFYALPIIGLDESDFSPAYASSGLPLEYRSSNENVATIVNGKIHLVGVGSTTIAASQPGNANYYAASKNVNQTLVVKLSQVITFNSNTRNLGESDFIFAAVNSGRPLSFKSYNKAVATIVGSRVHLVGEGDSPISAYASGNDTYAPSAVQFNKLTVRPEGALGLNDNNETTGKGFELFPNPATDYIRLKFKAFPLSVVIYNALGEKVFGLTSLHDELHISTCQIGGNGMYFVQVNRDIQKLIIANK